MNIATIGLDIAKHWFQVHGVDERGRTVVRRKLRRDGVLGYFRSLDPCLVGMEACATAHHWARELAALGREGIADSDSDRSRTALKGASGPKSAIQ